MRHQLIIITFLFTSTIILGQTKRIDSLELLLQRTEYDTTRVSLNYELAKAVYEHDIDKCKMYGEEALKFALKTDNYRLAEVYGLLGVLEFENSNAQASRDFYDLALEELDRQEDKVLRAVIYGNYSATYENTNNFDKELEYSLKAIELSQDIPEELGFLYFNHALIYDDAGFREEAEQYLKLALSYSVEQDNRRMEMYCLRQLSYYAMEARNYTIAKGYLDRGEDICIETNSKEHCFNIYFALGRLYMATEEFHEAEPYLNQAKELAISRNQPDDVKMSDIFLADLAYKKGQFENAVLKFNQLNIEANTIEDATVAKILLRNRSDSESQLGNYQKANGLLLDYLKFSDSLRLADNRDLLVQADRKYQTEKKNKEIAEQQLELNKKEGEILKKSSQIIYMTGIAMFLLVSALFIYFVFHQKQKRKNQEILALKREHQIKSLEALIEGEEKERFRIAKELHDGVNGDLSAIKFKLSTLLEMNNKVINEAITMIDDSCVQVRAISHNLVPPSLEKFSLVEAVETYCDSINVTNDVAISFQSIGQIFPLTKQAEINIFRIIQELVSNSIKHAQANEINVQISFQNNILQVTVEDDGIGYNKAEVKSDGIGLSNIDSRIEYLKATVDFISNANGTSFTFQMDINNLDEY